MKYLPLVWRNLMRRKFRTVLTILSVLVAFLLFGVLMAIRAAFSMGVEVAGADRLSMIHRVSIIQLLPKSYGDRIRATPGVTEVTHSNWFGAYFRDPNDSFFANMAVDPPTWLRMYPEFQAPEDQKKAWIADRTGAFVGVDTAKKYGWKIGDRIPLISPIYQRPDGSPWELTIDAIFDSDKPGVDKTQVFLHWDYLDQTYGDSGFLNHQVGWYVIRVADPSTSDQLAKRIDAMFANSEAETKTATEKAFVSDFAKQVGDIGAIMTGIAAVVMFFILFVTGNAMAHSIRERTNELAVLKTLGFSEGRILTLVLIESCVIAGIGGGIGLLLAWAIISAGDPTGGLLPTFNLPVRDVGIGAGLVVALGLATGLLPAFQASRLRIVDALRRTA